VDNGSITASFPADNWRSSPGVPVSYSSADCMAGNVTPLQYDWTDLASKVDAMQAGR
jgi:hypothetical protein